MAISEFAKAYHEKMLPAALRFGVTPVEVKEITYQAVAYPRSLNALACINRAAENN